MRDKFIYSSLCLCLFFSCNFDQSRKSDDTVIIPTPSQTEEEQSEVDRENWQQPELVVNKLGDLTDKTVADLGAGLGFFLVYIVPKAKKVIALDIDERATQWLTLVKSQYPTEMQGKIDIRLVEPADPKLAKDEVDAVLIVNTIAYISDRVEYLKKLRTSIKQDGMIQIVDYKLERLPIEAPPMDERADPLQLDRDLQAAGFQVIEKDYSSLKYQYIIIASDPD